VTPRVSVVVPAYNQAHFLNESLSSILRSDLLELEVMVVDDGSTDSTVEIVESFEDDRIRLLRQPHSGVVAAANHGFDCSRGEFVARLDADDVMMPGRLTRQLALFHARPRVIACGTNYELFGAATGRVRMPRTDRACRQRLLLVTCFAQSSVMMRRSAFSGHGLRYRDDHSGVAEDYQLWCEASEYGEFANIQSVGVRYRVHDEQVTAARWDELVDAYAEIAAEHAARAGYGSLSTADLLNIVGPVGSVEAPAGHFGLTARTNRAAAILTSAARAHGRAPGVETFRFVSRCVIERISELTRAGA
jgi:glycosyltransferase involved in cell wall biosynthesis